MPFTSEQLSQVILDWTGGMPKVQMCSKYNISEYCYRNLGKELKAKGLRRNTRTKGLFVHELDPLVKKYKDEHPHIPAGSPPKVRPKKQPGVDPEKYQRLAMENALLEVKLENKEAKLEKIKQEQIKQQSKPKDDTSSDSDSEICLPNITPAELRAQAAKAAAATKAAAKKAAAKTSYKK